MRLRVRYQGASSHYLNFGIYDFTIDIGNPCLRDELQFESDFLETTQIEYRVYQKPSVYLVNQNAVKAFPPPVVNCPDIVFDVIKSDG